MGVGGVATCVRWIEVRNAAGHPTGHRDTSQQQTHLAPNVSSAEVVQPLARGKVTELEHHKDGEDWWTERLESKITNKMVLPFQKQRCEQLVLCYLPISK